MSQKKTKNLIIKWPNKSWTQLFRLKASLKKKNSSAYNLQVFQEVNTEYVLETYLSYNIKD